MGKALGVGIRLSFQALASWSRVWLLDKLLDGYIILIRLLIHFSEEGLDHDLALHLVSLVRAKYNVR